jgi:hypothetical protein
MSMTGMRSAGSVSRRNSAPPPFPSTISPGRDAGGAIVCSETVHHETDIVAALEAGLPVFTEKPDCAT